MGQDVLAEKQHEEQSETALAFGPTQASGGHVCYVYVKRLLDVVLAFALVVITMPLMLFIVGLIVIDSGWPPLYRQVRVGVHRSRRGGQIYWAERRFRMVKFRTMVQGADALGVHEQFIASFVAGEPPPHRAFEGAAFKLQGDARITRAGRWLRVTSLDELPQLFNVLAGTMSLVGPRPVPPYEVALYEPRHRERLAAMPGITGAWQVKGRGKVGFEEMVQLDIDYVRKQSLWLDLFLLLRTLPAVLTRRGAR
jgi:lipopolysaccharide/colanic/teichoic acid biosynthesis glycosyltransferase